MEYNKTYGYIGKIEYSGLFILGHARFRINFEGGASTPSGLQPATFNTSNKALQMVIENSKEFINGKIKLISCIEVEEDESVIIAESVEDAADVTRYEDVTTAQMAREVLKRDFGASQGELQNAASIKAYAEKVNVSFPNWQ